MNLGRQFGGANRYFGWVWQKSVTFLYVPSSCWSTPNYRIIIGPHFRPAPYKNQKGTKRGIRYTTICLDTTTNRTCGCLECLWGGRPSSRSPGDHPQQPVCCHGFGPYPPRGGTSLHSDADAVPDVEGVDMREDSGGDFHTHGGVCVPT